VTLKDNERQILAGGRHLDPKRIICVWRCWAGM